MPDEERSPADKAMRACGFCCAGWLIFPITIAVLGWNEKNFVCTNKTLLQAKKDAAVVKCDYVPKDDNEFIALSCDIDKKDAGYHKFTVDEFLEGDAKTFGEIISFSSLAGKRSAPEMYQCVEKSSTEKVNKQCQDSKDSAGKTVKCETKTVYSYDMQWKAGTDALKNWASVTLGTQKSCAELKGGKNPKYPEALVSGNAMTKGLPENVKLTGTFSITKAVGSATFKPDKVLALSSFKHTKLTKPTPQKDYRATFDLDHTLIVGNYLQTCSTSKMGCTRISFYQNTDTGASFLGSSGAKGSGLLATMRMKASWGCGAHDFYKLHMGRLDKDKILEIANKSNDLQLWVLRVLGVLGAWGAIYMCLYPIVAFFDIMEDYMARVPCIGPCLSIVGSIVEWLVTIVVCCMSCSFGCSAAMFTIAIVWLVMRPLQGALYFGICCLMVGGAVALAHFAPKKEGSQARDLSVELHAPA